LLQSEMCAQLTLLGATNWGKKKVW